VLLLTNALWGTRLALYIFSRSRGKPEDHRYAKFRQEWQPWPNLNAWIKVFMFQGILMMIVTLPISVGMTLESKTLSVINYIGVIVWIVGFTLEIIADHYLNWWKSRPENKGKICTSGPWKFARFPNYFGEISLWYGVYLIAFDPKIAWTIIGPITINFLIVKVTGIPLLEKHYQGRIDYQEYAKRVPRLIPFTKP
jgi:steroid 5-alpha reductase family enzyme